MQQTESAQPRQANTSARRTVARRSERSTASARRQPQVASRNRAPAVPSPASRGVKPLPPSRANASEPAAPPSEPAEAGSSAGWFASTDFERIERAGIRRLESRHLTLLTDLASSPEVDELPRVFDLAVEPWCEYFAVNPASVESWKMTGYIMKRPDTFAALGLLPDSLPPFQNGYALGNQLWVHDQPTAYYLRHLLLHEGTHAFMQAHLHGMGPPWYSEGIAELMGTHRWRDGQLRLRYFPTGHEQVPHWGRIKIVRDEFEAGRALTIEQISQYGPRAHLQNAPYGWCWAVAALLDGHPSYAERFRRLSRRADNTTRDFERLFKTLFGTDQREMDEQWQLFVANLEYGYDIEREAIIYQPVEPYDGKSIVITVRADRGWQSTGLSVSANTTYQLRASGRYQVARQPKIWWCEPGGVTIRYHNGYPLGMLLGAVSDQRRPLPELTTLAQPQPIGLQRQLQFANSGTLFLRVNDSPAALSDNAGQLQVELRQISATSR